MATNPQTRRDSRRPLQRLVLRWANMEMAKRMTSLTNPAAGDEMDDDCQTAMLELLAAARPGKWAAWRKALKSQNERTQARRAPDVATNKRRNPASPAVTG